MENSRWWKRVRSWFTSCVRPRSSASGEALVDAAEKGDLDAVRTLLAECARSDTNVPYRDTALVLAAYHEHEEVVQMLLASDDRPHGNSDRVATALVRAAASGHFGIIRLMAAARPEAFLTETAALALTRAAQNGRHRCVRQLLLGGTPADARPPDGCGLPALFAAAANDARCVAELLNAGADTNQVDDNGRTPLHHASEANEDGCIYELVMAGADRNAHDHAGRIPWDEAISEYARDVLLPGRSPIQRPPLDDSVGSSVASSVAIH